MGLMTGKKGIILGVANDKSIAWGIAQKLHAEGAPVIFKTSGPFYVGVGFVSHLPANVLTAKVGDVVVENAAGRIR